jgi:CBS domain-containing protein
MYEFLEYQVADAMTYRPLTITRTTPLAEVETLFEQHDFNCLPVCEEGVLFGIVTKLDVLKAFAFTTRTIVPRYDDIMQQSAETVMTQKPVTVTPDVPLTRVLQLMADTRYRSFPVVVGALLVGVIAREDVLRALRRAAAGERPRSGPQRRRSEDGRVPADRPV